jgi:hypothetical protein
VHPETLNVAKAPEPDPKPLGNRDIWQLILATYRTSLPYLLIFLAGMLLATWFFTEVVF